MKIQGEQTIPSPIKNAQVSGHLLVLDSELAEQLSCDLFRRIRWYDGVVCPHCRVGSEMEGTIGYDGWLGFTRKYYCRTCQSYFNDRTGTQMSASPLGMVTWFEAIQLIGAGLPNQSLHHRLGVHPNTAQSIGVRLRRALAAADPLIGCIFRHLSSGDGDIFKRNGAI